jgi:DNA-binding transcriptional LysR family regulator
MMNLRHIEVFHAVYTHGSVSAAARALNVAQPSVSKMLRHAESRVGFHLFHRKGGRLTPTDEARLLFVEIDEIYAKMNSLRQTSINIGRSVNGVARLAVMPGFGLDVAPNAVAAFRRKYPTVKVDIHTVHHVDIPRALIERTCDVAVGYDPVHHPRLARTQIGSGELVLLFRKGEFPDNAGPIPLEELAGRDFISLIHSGPLGKLFNDAVERLKIDLNDTITINTMYIAASLVRQGLGIALVDDFTARAYSGEELEFRQVEPRLRFGVHCIYLADRPLSRLMKQVTDILRGSMCSANGNSHDLLEVVKDPGGRRSLTPRARV